MKEEKEKTKKNSSEIEVLNKDVNYLLQQNIKNKLVIKEDSMPSSLPNDNDELSLIKEENKRLKLYFKTLENEKIKRMENTKRIKALEKIASNIKVIEKTTKLKEIKTINTKYKVVFTKDVALYVKPYSTSKIHRYVKYGDILDIEKCTYYDWCKVRGKKEYIAKYKIKKIN